MSEGWIKLHRSLLDNPVWQKKPYSEGQAWVDLLLRATFQHQVIKKNKKAVKIPRGFVHFSVRDLAEKWGWSKDKIHRYKLTLKTEKMIETCKIDSTPLIKILNYNKYNEIEQKNGARQVRPKIATLFETSEIYINPSSETSNNNEKNEIATKSATSEAKNRDSLTLLLKNSYKKTNTCSNASSNKHLFDPKKWEIFWAEYPKKHDKKRALKAFKKIKMTDELFEKIMTSLRKWKVSREWQEGFIPLPTTWLNGERWEDEIYSTNPEERAKQEYLEKFPEMKGLI